VAGFTKRRKAFESKFAHDEALPVTTYQLPPWCLSRCVPEHGARRRFFLGVRHRPNGRPAMHETCARSC